MSVRKEGLKTGTKFDEGKNRLDLIPSEAIEAVGKILTHGAAKYEVHNWRKGIHYSRVIGAAFRHLFAWLRGEQNDADSGCSHLWHAMCNICFLITYEAHPKEYKDFDDRYIYNIPKASPVYGSCTDSEPKPKHKGNFAP